MPRTVDVTGLPKHAVRLVESLVSLLRDTPKPSTNGEEELSDAQFEKTLDAVSKGLPKLPVLPRDFSREDIYHDHD